MVVMPVEHGDIDRRAAQRLGRFQPAEAGADDDDLRTLLRHGGLQRRIIDAAGGL